jgi:4-azaleucine resistance transporter AzlC
MRHKRLPIKSGFRGFFLRALQYTFPVFLGYISAGAAFGLILSGEGYPWWLAVLSALVMYAGAGQYIAAQLFASGAGIPEAALVQFVVNARHIAYGLTLFDRINAAGRYKPYIIFGLTDETFALHVSNSNEDERKQPRFMFLITLLDQFYWTSGCLIGAVAGHFIPFDMTGVDFALTALFVVLTAEQFLSLRVWRPFIISAIISVLTLLFIPSRIALLAAIILSLAAVQGADTLVQKRKREGGEPC